MKEGLMTFSIFPVCSRAVAARVGGALGTDQNGDQGTWLHEEGLVLLHL